MNFYTHPAFIDVVFQLRKAFYIKEKDLWEMKVTWFHRRKGLELGRDKFYVTPEKKKEFIRWS